MHTAGVGAKAGETWMTVEELFDRHLGVGRPSEQAMKVLKTVEQQRPEVREFTERGFRLMAISKFDARDISPVVARFFAIMAPAILPGAWGGMVPPITIPGRHKKIDEYLRKNAWAEFDAGIVLLDVGCGFPPQTAMDAAEAFPDWQILGVDPAFEDYLVYDENGNYASISRTGERSGRVRYFQPAPQNFLALFADRDATIRKFEETFARLLAEMPEDDGTLASAERDGTRLVRHPMKQYERPNLGFVQAGFGSEDVPRADVVRAFNVLLYYDTEFRRMAEEWAAKILVREGYSFAGGTMLRR